MEALDTNAGLWMGRTGSVRQVADADADHVACGQAVFGGNPADGLAARDDALAA
jgi:hypothetical protein